MYVIWRYSVYQRLSFIPALLLATTSHAFEPQTNNIDPSVESWGYLTSDSYQNALTQNPLSLSLTEEPIEILPNTETEALPKYLRTASTKDWDYLKEQTYTILGLSVATVGLMTFLPESVTNWTDEDRDFNNLAQKWWDNVSAGPVFDKDDHYLNYIMHPYFGGAYYTAARHSGYGQFDSFLYSFVMSTFFWEYGVESFAEIPSAQDIVVTPLFGAAVGEWMYLGEQKILQNGGEVLGSTSLANVSLFILNPVGHIHHWITSIWRDDVSVSPSYSPWMGNQEAAKFAMDAGAEISEPFIGLQTEFRF